MRLNSVAPDLTVRIAVEIVTELLRFIFIKIEFHEAPFSHMSSCEQEDRVLHQGLNFHSAVVHCPPEAQAYTGPLESRLSALEAACKLYGSKTLRYKSD